jgi:hypothetical protein
MACAVWLGMRITFVVDEANTLGHVHDIFEGSPEDVLRILIGEYVPAADHWFVTMPGEMPQHFPHDRHGLRA